MSDNILYVKLALFNFPVLPSPSLYLNLNVRRYYSSLK